MEKVTDEERYKKAIGANLNSIFSTVRENFSQETEIIMTKINNGEMINDIEAFTLVCDDPEKIAQYSTMYNLRNNVEEGNLTLEELKYLCDTAFGSESKEGKQIFDAMIVRGKIETDDLTYGTSLRDMITSTFGADNPSNAQLYERIMNNRLANKMQSSQNTDNNIR